MTRNQLEYWNLIEQKRHNAAVEAETGRHQYFQDQELYRHNVEAEQQGRTNLLETQTHNRASEALTSRQLGISERQTSETARSNRAQEAIARSRNILESKKVDVSMRQLSETIRSNKAKESISLGTLAESQRSNQAREKLTSEQNAEARRHNKMGENISLLDTGLRGLETSANLLLKGGSTYHGYK